MSRRMVHLVHADNFYPQHEANSLRAFGRVGQFVQKPYGLEIPNFNLIFPDLEIILYTVLGERVTVDPKRSGVFRKPSRDAVWHENFDSTEEWCFVIALEPTVVNFYYHTDPSLAMGDLAPATETNALQPGNYNFNNLFEWKIHTNIYLDTNQCLFFRPWVFHNMHDGLIQYFRLLADDKLRVLVMGMPGSCRAKLAQALVQRMGDDASVLRSIDIRTKKKDLDFGQSGQLRHCYRMLELARSSATLITVIDMVCPLEKMREILNADLVIWCSDHPVSQYPELNTMFEPPYNFDIECTDSDDKTVDLVIKRLMTTRLR
jgi:hypothetical protein